MPIETGAQTTYKDTGRFIRSVVDSFPLIGHKCLLLSRLIGGSPDKPMLDDLPATVFNVNSTKLEWYDKRLRPQRLTLGANILVGDGTITISPAADAQYITKGQVIQIGNEVMIASAAGVVGGTVAVNRARAQTSAAAVTADATKKQVRLVGRAFGEESDTPVDPFITMGNQYNYWQGVRQTISATWKRQAIATYGESGDWLKMAEAEAMLEACRQLEWSMVYGPRNEGDGSDANPSMFGGLSYFSTPDDYAGNTLSADRLSDTIRSMWETGGDDVVPNLMLCSGKTRTKMSKIYGTSYVTPQRDEGTKEAGIIVDKVNFDFASVDIMPLPWIEDDHIFLLRDDRVGLGALKGNGKDWSFALYQAPTAGPRDHYYIYGEYSGVFEVSDTRRWIKNFVLP